VGRLVGDDTPFHTPVFVLTHHERPSITLGDTTFHFLDATPQDALAQAFEAADGKDVRIGGGVATVREFLDADPSTKCISRLRPSSLVAARDCGQSRRSRRSVLPGESPEPEWVTHLFFWRRYGQTIGRFVVPE